MNKYFPRIALMLGNVVTGLAVLGPAGMLAALADGLHVGIRDAGLLVTYGAVVLCVGSPLIAWLTTRFDRRALLVTTLALVAFFQAASALAPNYATVLMLRLAMLAAAAIYTPQAAATVALIVPEKQRASAIAVVFLGWSVAIAIGLPLVTIIAAHFGWRAVFGILGLVSALGALLLYASLPSGLQGRPLSLASFAVIARNKRIVSALAITLVQTSGQFTVFVYLAPLLKSLCRRRSRGGRRFLRALWRGRAGRQRHRQRHRNGAGRADDLGAVPDVDFLGTGAVGGGRRLAGGHGRRRVLLGARLLRH